MPTLTQDEILSALKSCYDPEIPVNIVDLGLIYEVAIEPVGPETDRTAGRHGKDDPHLARMPRARQHQRASEGPR